MKLMKQKSLLDVISSVITRFSSSHTTSIAVLGLNLEQTSFGGLTA